jgi:histamine N-methyltransferase
MSSTTKLKKGRRLASPLSKEAYSKGFKCYKRNSTECEVMLGWIRDKLLEGIPQRDSFRVLSVGSGTGDFDSRLLRILVSRLGHIEYVAVEPSEVHCEQCKARLAADSLPDVQCEVHPVLFEEFGADGCFDLVHFTHSLYYIPDREAAVMRALDLIADDGRVLVLHQTTTGINQIQRRFLKRVKGDENEMFSSKELREILERRDIPYDLDVLDSHIDVTECLDLECESGQDLLNFFLECDLSGLEPEVKHELLSCVDGLSMLDRGRRLMLQPVAIFSIYKKTRR